VLILLCCFLFTFVLFFLAFMFFYFYEVYFLLLLFCFCFCLFLSSSLVQNNKPLNFSQCQGNETGPISIFHHSCFQCKNAYSLLFLFVLLAGIHLRDDHDAVNHELHEWAVPSFFPAHPPHKQKPRRDHLQETELHPGISSIKLPVLVMAAGRTWWHSGVMCAA